MKKGTINILLIIGVIIIFVMFVLPMLMPKEPAGETIAGGGARVGLFR